MDGDWEAPLIPNPLCEKAAGCGEWSPPMINNPEYKGKWRAPLVPNPNYQGRWKPRRIANPDFFEDKHPFRMTSIVRLSSAGIFFNSNFGRGTIFIIVCQLTHLVYLTGCCWI